ncbi:MAG: formate dehydrogenase accessory sulfurtransferase FdhD [Acidobacteria bacterium]|nr:formate dehydrogenase accessory sulfurtransferase FdhD [Acidobacteriota bacterium]
MKSTTNHENTVRSVQEVRVCRIEGVHADAAADLVAVEEPMEIQLAYGPPNARLLKSISVTMRTPGEDFDLAVGFLVTEGVVRDASDIERVQDVSTSAGQNVVRVELAPEVEVRLATLERNFYTTSSCGICGKASLLALRSVSPPRVRSEFRMALDVLYSLPAALRAAQNVFEQTGGLHGAALFDSRGKLHAVREDVGRHNAVDKLVGSEFRKDHAPLRDRLLMLSGRASFELLQKALMAGLPAVAAVGAPSSLAVQVAKEFDITLVGFLREDHLNIYHGEQRIVPN